ERTELVFAEGICQREHGCVVLDFCESFERFASDALSWRIGRREFGMRGFEFEQLAKHPVVFGVRDFGIVFNVVKVVMVFEFLPQLSDAGCYAVDVDLSGHNGSVMLKMSLAWHRLAGKVVIVEMR